MLLSKIYPLQVLSPWKRKLATPQALGQRWLDSLRIPCGSALAKRSFTSTLLFRHVHPNPGNFANRPKHELREISKKGGQKGGRATGVGGFHEMDPEKRREIASKGGRASHHTSEKKSTSTGTPKAEHAKRGRPRKQPSSFETYDGILI